MIVGLTLQEQERLRRAAFSWRGTPYHPDARIKGAGVDCGNLLIAIYAEADLIAPFPLEPQPHGWFLHSDDERYIRYILERAVTVAPPWEPGDLLLFRGWRWPSAGHGGIYVGDDLLIHAVEGRRVEGWPLSSSVLRRTFDSAYRLKRDG